MSEQQATAWMYTRGDGSVEYFSDQWADLKVKGWVETPLYATPKSSEGELLNEAVEILALLCNPALTTKQRFNAFKVGRAFLAKAGADHE